MNCIIGIDLGGTIVKIGLVSEGKVLAGTRVQANSISGLRRMLGPIGEAADSLLAQNGISKSSISGVAMAFPGIVDFPARRAALTNAKYDDAPSVDVEEWAAQRYDAPFKMDNDARMAMIGEWTSGAGKGVENMVMMTIGTGIGTGVVIDSRPLYGRNGCAGSLGGHMIVDYRGCRCTCGNIGCVEAHGSSFFLPRIIEENLSLQESFRNDPSNRSFKVLFDKYRQNNPDAVNVVNGCMDVWAAAIVNYIHAYDPEKIVLGGGIMKSSDIILPYIREKVGSLAWCPGEKPEIVSSILGDEAALIGSEYYFNQGV